MSVIRKYIQNLDRIDLSALWYEAEDWETIGVLPEDAAIRMHIRDCIGAGKEFPSFTLLAPFFFSEAYREIAIRCGALEEFLL